MDGARRSTSLARASAARRTDKADGLERLPDHQRHLAHLRPRHAWDRVKVHAELVRVIEVLGADRVRVEIETAEVGDPREPRRLVHDDLVRGPSRGEGQGCDPHPVRPVVGSPLLEERLLLGAVDEALERHRAAAHAHQGTIGHGEEVAHEVQLGVPGARKVDLVRVADRDLAAADLEELLPGGHSMMLGGRGKRTSAGGAVAGARPVSVCPGARRLSIPAPAVRRYDDDPDGPGLEARRTATVRYLLMIYEEPPATPPTDGDWAEMMDGYTAFSAWLRERDWHVAAEALQDVSTATTVTVRDGRRIVTDGPFAETKEHLGGFYLINAPSLDDAIEAAARIPGAATGKVEIRPIQELG
jgi:hypothetical protein